MLRQASKTSLFSMMSNHQPVNKTIFDALRRTVSCLCFFLSVCVLFVFACICLEALSCKLLCLFVGIFLWFIMDLSLNRLIVSSYIPTLLHVRCCRVVCCLCSRSASVEYIVYIVEGKRCKIVPIPWKKAKCYQIL